MATADLIWTDTLENDGWLFPENVESSDDVRVIAGQPPESFKFNVSNAPADFGSQNGVTLHVEARISGTPSRTKQVLVELLDSADTVLESFVTPDLTTSDRADESSFFSRNDSKSVIDGYRVRCTAQEGGGMPDAMTHEIDFAKVILDYNPSTPAPELSWRGEQPQPTPIVPEVVSY